MADRAKRYLCDGRFCDRLRVFRNASVWSCETCPDPVWTASCLLHAVLADGCRWNEGSGRTACAGRTEYLFCGTRGLCQHCTFQRGCDQIFFGRIYFHDLWSARRGVCHVSLCETGEKEGSGRTAFIRRTGKHDNRYNRAIGVFVFVCGTGALCCAGHSGRIGLYDRTYAECGGRTDLFRRAA